MAAAACGATAVRVERRDGVALAADDRHDHGGRQRDEDENARDDDDRDQRAGPVLGAHHVDETIERRASTHRGRSS